MFLAVFAAALGLGACGYRLDSPRLPDNAGTLFIAPIRNRTTTGELDIRLAHLLRSRLLRHASFDLAAQEAADMTLDVQLTELRVTRVRDLTSTSVSSIVYTLKGEASLLDRRTRRYYFQRVAVMANSRLDFAAAVVETPAIQDEGLTGVLDKFAERLEALVLPGF